MLLYRSLFNYDTSITVGEIKRVMVVNSTINIIYHLRSPSCPLTIIHHLYANKHCAISPVIKHLLPSDPTQAELCIKISFMRKKRKENVRIGSAVCNLSVEYIDWLCV